MYRILVVPGYYEKYLFTATKLKMMHFFHIKRRRRAIKNL